MRKNRFIRYERHHYKQSQDLIRSYADMDLSGEIFSLEDLCGTWHTMSLSPTLLIYKDHSMYKMSILHIGDSGQAEPETIQIKEDTCYFIKRNRERQELCYLANRDRLLICSLGEYCRKAQ